MAAKTAMVEPGGCAPKGRWIGTEAAAEYLGVCKSTLKDWRKARVVPYSKLHGLLRYNTAELDEVLRRNHVPAMGITGIV